PRTTFFFSSRRRHTRLQGDWSSDVCSSDLLVRGTYGQRQSDDAQMVRVKIPQGVLTADQLDALADVGDRYSRGFGHITTRQNMQIGRASCRERVEISEVAGSVKRNGGELEE